MKVSWVRLSDWHILTTGVVTYTKDDRISVLYKEGSLDWILKVDVVISPPLCHSTQTFIIFRSNMSKYQMVEFTNVKFPFLLELSPRKSF